MAEQTGLRLAFKLNFEENRTWSIPGSEKFGQEPIGTRLQQHYSRCVRASYAIEDM